MKQVLPGEISSLPKTVSGAPARVLGFVCLAALAIAFAVGLHIYRKSGIAFTNTDDILMGLTADRMRTHGWWSAYFDLARTYALWEGRIYFYFSMIFFVLPFLIRSLVLRAVLSALLQLSATCSVGAVVGLYTGWRSALLYVMLACAWLPYWLAVSPVIGFPFVYHLPVTLFFAGLAVRILLARGYPRWRTPLRVLSWGAIFLSLFFYETLLPQFFVIAVVVSAAEARRAQGAWSRSAALRAWTPWAVCFGLWTLVYLGFRWLYPSTYTGSAVTAVGRGELGSAATTLFYFEAYSLPGANWIGNLHYNLPRLWGSPESLGYVRFFWRNLGADQVVLALLVLAALAAWALGWSSRGGKAREGAAGKIATLAVICGVMSPLPLVLTAKYRAPETIMTMAPYLPGYYGFLAWCAALAMCFPLLASALRRIPVAAWTATAVLAAVCAVAGAASAMSNDALYRQFLASSNKWKLVDRLAQSRWFAALPAHSVFLAPGLWDNFPLTAWITQDDYWTEYFSGWAGRPMRVVRLPREVPDLLGRREPVFYCEHQWLAGRLDAVLAIEPVVSISPAGEAVSDSLLLVSQGSHGLSPAGMEVEYRTPASDAAGTGLLRAQIAEWRRDPDGAFLAQLPLPGLIAGTARIVDAGGGALPAGPIVQFQRGFSPGTERDAKGQYWRWSDGADGTGELNLFNPSARPVTVRFRAGLHFYPGHAAFELILPQGSESFTAAAGETIERVWRLAPGANRVIVKCHAGRLPSPGDPRYIVFGLWNWSLTPLEDHP